MGEKQPKRAEELKEGYTQVNGLVIAALIARAMPLETRKRILARISNQSPVVGAALGASIEKVEGQIAARTAAVARQISTQIALPQPESTEPLQPMIRKINIHLAEETAAQEERSPAEMLLEAREGSHEDLERQLEKQKVTPGRRRIISA